MSLEAAKINLQAAGYMIEAAQKISGAVEDLRQSIVMFEANVTELRRLADELEERRRRNQ